MLICPCCKQLLPETSIDKAVARAKVVISVFIRDEAKARWAAYKKAHRAQSVWLRNPELGMLVSAGLTAAFIAFELWLQSTDGTTFGETPSDFFFAIAFALLVGYLFYIKPAFKLQKHYAAVRNAFVIRHKAAAIVLGLTVLNK